MLNAVSGCVAGVLGDARRDGPGFEEKRTIVVLVTRYNSGSEVVLGIVDKQLT